MSEPDEEGRLEFEQAYREGTEAYGAARRSDECPYGTGEEEEVDVMRWCGWMGGWAQAFCDAHGIKTYTSEQLNQKLAC